MLQYTRTIDVYFSKWLPKKEIIILYGARQIGKTTYLKSFTKKNTNNAIYLNCELPHVESILQSKNFSRIKALFGDNKYICLDEAQSIENIGTILKLIYDELPEYKMIATGSSSFELANELIEPLTGRHIKMQMYPLTLQEIASKDSYLDIEQNLHDILIYGLYPEIYTLTHKYKSEKLLQISTDYMFKDILKHNDIRQSDLLRKILKFIAFAVGSEISSNNLANEFGVSRLTIERYLDLLEKSFIIFSIHSFSRNLGNELKKSKKYYFYDNGMRNALINNFNDIESRSDIGGLWENFCVTEIIKTKAADIEPNNFYFWRTYDQAEIDLIYEEDGKLDVWEFKWNSRKKTSFPKSFMNTYQVNKAVVITRDDLYQFLASSDKKTMKTG